MATSRGASAPKITLTAAQKQWETLLSDGRYNSANMLDAVGRAIGKNPYLQNQRLKQIKSTVANYTREELETAIKNPADNELKLRQESWGLSFAIYPLLKLYHMYSDILTYRNYVYPKYVSAAEAKKPMFASDMALAQKWMDKLDPKHTLRNIVLDVMREGKKSYYLRQRITPEGNVEYVILQELPSDYIKYTHKSQYSTYVTSFNMMYFISYPWAIESYQPLFDKYFADFQRAYDPRTGKLDMSAVPSYATIEGGNGGDMFMYWVELPADECWCFSHDESHPLQIPNFVGLFCDTEDLQSYKFLQQQLWSMPLNSMLTAEVPLTDQSKTGDHTNDTRISEGLITYFTNLFTAIAPQGVGFYAAPFQNFKLMEFKQAENRNNVVGDAIQQWFSGAGVSGLSSTSEKPSLAMIKAAQILEPRYVDKLYRQFEVFVNCVFERQLGLKHIIRAKFFGNVFEDAETLKEVKEGLAAGHTSLLPKYYSLQDLDMEEAVSIGYYVGSTGIYKSFKPLLEVQPKIPQKEGRKEIPDKELENDDTAQAKERGATTKEGRVVGKPKEVKQ